MRCGSHINRASDSSRFAKRSKLNSDESRVTLSLTIALVRQLFILSRRSSLYSHPTLKRTILSMRTRSSSLTLDQMMCYPLFCPPKLIQMFLSSSNEKI